MRNRKSVVLLSGGLDSAVVLAQTLDFTPPEHVTALSFYYGSKHNVWENVAAGKICDHYKVAHRVMDLSGALANLKSALLLSNQEQVPEGHYEEESMRQTVVPGRNLLFLSCAAALAESTGARFVQAGFHAGDHFIYPDCRPDFVVAANRAIVNSSDGKVQLVTPLLYMEKSEVVERGLKLGVPFNLTRTCYTAHEIACGKCGSCVERREAFMKNKEKDPLPYQHEGPLPVKGVT
jgi:7-cyano-7-deazaguanine synthase